MSELINGRTPEAIKGALYVCTNGGCNRYNCAYECDGDCSGSVMREALALIKHLEAQQPKWISVKERLPDPFISVLVHMTDMEDFPTVREGYRVDDWRFFIPLLCEHHRVDYWMPLPEPKGEEK